MIVDSSKISSFRFDASNFFFCYSGVQTPLIRLTVQILHSLILLFTASKGYAQGLDEQFVVKRLAQESYGPACQSPRGCAWFVVSRDKNYRKPAVKTGQSLVYLQSVQARDLHVKNNAINIKRWHRLENRNELLAGRKRLCVYSERANQTLYGTANGLIVVYNNDAWLCTARDNLLLCTRAESGMPFLSCTE
jgi:hypothetical protein